MLTLRRQHVPQQEGEYQSAEHGVDVVRQRVALSHRHPSLSTTCLANMAVERSFLTSLAANAAVFMIYWYIVTFAFTWGPLAWVVSAEVSAQSDWAC